MSLPQSMTGGRRLYLITPPRFDARAFAAPLAAALDAAPIAALQIRLKTHEQAQWAQAVDLLLPIARARAVAVLMTDRIELARRSGCDGVQLTSAGTQTVAGARAALGAGAVIGVVCDNDMAAALAAADGGADYVAFGALSATELAVPPTPADPQIIRAWSGCCATPSLAIGRIRPQTCQALIAAGSTFLAGISAIWDHPDGAAAGARAMSDAIGQALARECGPGADASPGPC